MRKETLHFSSTAQARAVYANDDATLSLIEKVLNVKLVSRGDFIKIMGAPEEVQETCKLIKELKKIVDRGDRVKREDIAALLSFHSNHQPNEQDIQNGIHVSSVKSVITPKSRNQELYIKAIRNYDIVFGIGPAGTGKTYLAMAMAVSWLLEDKIRRIILTRPAVEAGENLGFLPGTLHEKINPYLRPLYDALYDMLEAEKIQRFLDRGLIEVAPLAFMRGRTLNDSFIILDEAQNTTIEQMKMFLTRIGFHSKTVVTGDITQIDLPGAKKSGLVHAKEILHNIRGIKISGFTANDVVRHPLVKKIIQAYEENHMKDDTKKGKK
ncbi:MAG: PhoH family protein [Chlamydiota bacterium]|nr:PhoH family protein [Chlamydiota bacterium]